MPIYPNSAVNKSKYCAFTEGKEITSITVDIKEKIIL